MSFYKKREQNESPIAQDDHIIYSENKKGNNAHHSSDGKFASKDFQKELIKNFTSFLRDEIKDGHSIKSDLIAFKSEKVWDRLPEEKKEALMDMLYSKLATSVALYRGYEANKEDEIENSEEFKMVQELANNFLKYDSQRKSFKPFKSSENYEEALKRFSESCEIIGNKKTGLPIEGNIDANIYTPFAQSELIPEIMEQFWNKGIPCDVVKNPFPELDKRGIDYWFYYKGYDGTIYRRTIDQKFSKDNVKIDLFSDSTVLGVDDDGNKNFGSFTLESIIENGSENKKYKNELDFLNHFKDWGMKNTDGVFNQTFIRDKETEEAMAKTLGIPLEELENSIDISKQDILTDDYLFATYSFDPNTNKNVINSAYLSKQELHKNIKNMLGGKSNITTDAAVLLKLAKERFTSPNIDEFDSKQKRLFDVLRIKMFSNRDNSVIFRKYYGPKTYIGLTVTKENGKHNCRLALYSDLDALSKNNSSLKFYNDEPLVEQTEEGKRPGNFSINSDEIYDKNGRKLDSNFIFKKKGT